MLGGLHRINGCTTCNWRSWSTLARPRMIPQFICLTIFTCLWPRDGAVPLCDSQSSINHWISMIYGDLLDLGQGNGCSYLGALDHLIGTGDSLTSPSSYTICVVNPLILAFTALLTIRTPISAKWSTRDGLVQTWFSTLMVTTCLEYQIEIFQLC